MPLSAISAMLTTGDDAPSATISGEMFLLVLFSASMHAGWNFFAKRTKGHVGVMCLSVWLSGVMCAPLLVYSLADRRMRGEFVKTWSTDIAIFPIMSGVLHAFYMKILGSAYASGYFSTVYPVSRGSGIVMLTILSSFLFAEKIGWPGAIGISLIGLGVLLIGLHDVVTAWWIKELNALRTMTSDKQKDGSVQPQHQQDGDHYVVSVEKPIENVESPTTSEEPVSESEDEANQESTSLMRNTHRASSVGGDSSSAASDGQAGHSSQVPSSTTSVDSTTDVSVRPPVELGFGPWSYLVPAEVGVPLLSLIVGVLICSYTLVDKYAADRVPSTVLLPGIFVTSSICLSPYIFFFIWPQVKEAWREFQMELWIIAIGSPYCYYLILFAYSRSHVAYVAATRESCVLMGAMLGIFVLREPAGVSKWAGIAAVAVGLVFIRAGFAKRAGD